MASIAPEASPRIKIETVLAWTSIAYASGFLVVLLHTGSLGIPVIELIKPIYVWIGLPFAILGFFANRLLQVARSRAQIHFQDLRRAVERRPQWDKGGIDPEPWQERAFAEYFNLAPTLTPWNLLGRYAGRRIFDGLDEAGDDKAKQRRLMRSIDRELRVWRLLRAYLGVLELASVMAILAVAVLGYVNTAYPHIPQVYGGGQSLRVMLVVDGPRMSTLLSTPSTTAVNTRTVDLLYRASDAYWVRIVSKSLGCVLDSLPLPVSHSIKATARVSDSSCIVGIDEAAVAAVILAP
jgi:hypothetical protein